MRGSVLMRRWDSPLSPIALRAALMQLVSVDSETMRPFQIAAMRGLAGDELAVADQMHQKVEDLGLNG